LQIQALIDSGHSMGAMSVASASTKANVQVIVLMAELGGSPVPASSSLKSVLVIGGMVDTVTLWSADVSLRRSHRCVGGRRGEGEVLRTRRVPAFAVRLRTKHDH
jgi:hypothetical protein